MTLIDQRILIDAPLDVVWKMLTDPRELRGWHLGYTSVSILTTHETGEGVRRRCGLADTGKDVFEEITAWVDGLGYEYQVVEGGPYRSLTGRFRLQAIPDGTSLQWVIMYEPKGLFGALRDRLGGKRQVTTMMAESLRELRRRVNALGVRMDEDARARVGIRGRLDANERAQYQRRYGETGMGDDAALPGEAPGAESAPPASAVTPPVPVPPVPSFVADLTGDEPDYNAKADTKPRKPKSVADAIAAQQTQAAEVEAEVAPEPMPRTPTPPEPMPAVAASPVTPVIPEPPVSDEDTPPSGTAAVPRVPTDEGPVTAPAAGAALPYASDTADFAPPVTPAPPAALPVEPARRAPEPAPAEDSDASPAPEEETPFHKKITPPRGIKITPPEHESVRMTSQEMPVVVTPETRTPSVPTLPPPPAEIVPPGAERPPQTPKHDTGEMSIWEAFGVQRPSEHDSRALDHLIRVAQARERMGYRRGRRLLKRPVRARSANIAGIGLRLRHALQRVRVRLFWRKG